MAVASPSWVEHCIWWHVYPLGFRGAPVRDGHDEAPRLRRLIGCWTTPSSSASRASRSARSSPRRPTATTPSTTTGSTRDQGTDADLDALVAACRDRGLPLRLDGVFTTTGGVPAVYYGDEQAFTGIKEERLGGDDAVRPAYREEPGQLAECGGWMYRAHQQLLGMRRRHPWLVRARVEQVELSNTRYVHRSCSVDGAQSLTVEPDVTDTPRATVRDAPGAELFGYR